MEIETSTEIYQALCNPKAKDILLTGQVAEFSAGGNPIINVESVHKKVMLIGFKTPYKPPIGAMATYILTDKAVQNKNMRLGTIVDDGFPIDKGTICGFDQYGRPLMNQDNRIFFVRSFIPNLEVGMVKNYKHIHHAAAYEISWVYDEPAIQSTIDGLFGILQKESVTANKILSEPLLSIQNQCWSGKYSAALSEVEKLQKSMHLNGLNQNYDLKSPVKFLEVYVREQLSNNHSK